MGWALQIPHWLSTVWSSLTQAAVAAWPTIWSFLNSNFITALAGAGLGAAAGAWAAQRIAKRDAAFEAAMQDIRSANSAITFASGILNSLTGLKRQFIVPFANDYEALVANHEAYRVLFAANPAMEPFHFNPDFRTLPPPEISTEELSDALRGYTGSDPAAWLMFQTLREILKTLNAIVIQRNEVIEEIRALPAARRGEIVPMYFGTPLPDGNTDSRYSEIMKHLPRVVNDALGFDRVLIEHLAEPDLRP